MGDLKKVFALDGVHTREGYFGLQGDL